VEQQDMLDVADAAILLCLSFALVLVAILFPAPQRLVLEAAGAGEILTVEAAELVCTAKAQMALREPEHFRVAKAVLVVAMGFAAVLFLAHTNLVVFTVAVPVVVMALGMQGMAQLGLFTPELPVNSHQLAWGHHEPVYPS
jgi:hypothetical protein